ncbi:sugar phosphate isomerase/epimerase family protein [Aquisediminimonas profunda]|uniref:sugar phosphate isomerase/epimerase family protein n=1 Tax=Aquisediminimonas profunda TaxID=1550733 RepID=UPI001C63247B|nr:sugar phosphate isomerase/epimerase family protein [Aquisediminimonas profunda]
MNLLLWTGHVTEAHVPLFRALRDTGFDGVEVPIFDASDPGHYRHLASILDDLGLARTVTATIPSKACSPISNDPAVRQAGFDHLSRVIECCEALGAEVMAGPWYQPLGVFSGQGPQPVEYERCAEVHRRVAPIAAGAGLVCALEVLNRFECYLFNTCEQASDYLDLLGEPGFGIHFDTFHANIEEKDSVGAVESAWAKGHLRHVHISENDRGTPGKGQAKIRETIAALKRLGYQDWLTIEAFGGTVPDLAAATRVWRPFFASEEEVYTEGHRYIHECWAGEGE